MKDGAHPVCSKHMDDTDSCSLSLLQSRIVISGSGVDTDTVGL